MHFGLHSALITLQVEDVNEFGPEFEKPVYVFELTAEKLLSKQQQQHSNQNSIQQQATTSKGNNSNISASSNGSLASHLKSQSSSMANELIDGQIFLGKLLAHDADCSSQFGTVCRYELIGTTNKPSSTSAENSNNNNLNSYPLQTATTTTTTTNGQTLKSNIATPVKFTQQTLLSKDKIIINSNDDDDDDIDKNDDLFTSYTKPLDLFYLEEFSGKLYVSKPKLLLKQLTSGSLSSIATVEKNSNDTTTIASNITFNLQALAYDCAGRKSQQPASITLHWIATPKCRPGIKGK